MPVRTRPGDVPADAYDVLVRTSPNARARPGRVFLGDDRLLVAPSRHGLPTRLLGDALDGLLLHLPESIGLYDPHAVSRTEAARSPDSLAIRYGDVTGLAPFVRPTGFSLHLRVADREDAVRLAFESSTEREETVELARAIRDRARAAGVDPEVYDPGGRARLLPIEG